MSKDSLKKRKQKVTNFEFGEEGKDVTSTGRFLVLQAWVCWYFEDLISIFY